MELKVQCAVCLYTLGLADLLAYGLQATFLLILWLLFSVGQMSLAMSSAASRLPSS